MVSSHLVNIQSLGFIPSTNLCELSLSRTLTYGSTMPVSDPFVLNDMSGLSDNWLAVKIWIKYHSIRRNESSANALAQSLGGYLIFAAVRKCILLRAFGFANALLVRINAATVATNYLILRCLVKAKDTTNGNLVKLTTYLNHPSFIPEESCIETKIVTAPSILELYASCMRYVHSVILIGGNPRAAWAYVHKIMFEQANMWDLYDSAPIGSLYLFGMLCETIGDSIIDVGLVNGRIFNTDAKEFFKKYLRRHNMRDHSLMYILGLLDHDVAREIVVKNFSKVKPTAELCMDFPVEKLVRIFRDIPPINIFYSLRCPCCYERIYYDLVMLKYLLNKDVSDISMDTVLYGRNHEPMGTMADMIAHAATLKI